MVQLIIGVVWQKRLRSHGKIEEGQTLSFGNGYHFYLKFGFLLARKTGIEAVSSVLASIKTLNLGCLGGF